MSEEFERIYNVNLGKAWLVPRQKRANKAITILRNFAKRHGRTEEVKISEDVNEFLWIRGKRHPPRKIQIKLIKDKEGIVTISSIESKKTISKEKQSKKEDKTIDVNPELKKEDVSALPEVEEKSEPVPEPKVEEKSEPVPEPKVEEK